MAQVRDIGVDLGTSHVLIYAKGNGIIARQPAIVAMERDSRRPIAIGHEAENMVGRTPNNVVAMRPFKNGTLADFELANIMLQNMLHQAIGKHFFARPRAVLSLPTGVNDTEKRSMISAMFDAGMRKTELIEKPIAAALGMGIPFEKAEGNLIVEMAAGCTDIAVLALGQVSVSDCVQIGGDYFDDAIIRYIRKKHNLLIGERTAEELKINIGCAVPRSEEVSMEVTGRSLVSGLPKTLAVTTDEICEALQQPVSDLIDAIQGVLEHTPPQLMNDIFVNGIFFSGGAAALTGLTTAVSSVLHLPCQMADDPQTAVVLGCGMAVEDGSILKALRSDRRVRF